MRLLDYIISRIPRHTSALTFMDDDTFRERVDKEVARISAHQAGVMLIEAQTLTEHLKQQEIPDVADLIELRAVTRELLEKYHYHKLDAWADADTHLAVFEKFKQTFFVKDKNRCWMQHILQTSYDFHLAEMNRDPLLWLIEWRPADIRLHRVKTEALNHALLSVRSEMLRLLAEREVALLQDTATAVLEAPDYQGRKLWHSVSDTRMMRGVVEAAWAAHPRVPPDYASHVINQPADYQLAFLAEKKQTILSLCAAERAQDMPMSSKDKNKNEHSLY